MISPLGRCLDKMELNSGVTTTDADMRIRPVVVPPVSERLLVVKFALDL